MEGAIAHSLGDKQRTEDVRLKEVTPFSKMPLSDAVRKGLQKCNFVYPTVIQATAIPVGRSGMDLLVQSKSGTGKTLIFATIVLEAYRSNVLEPQSLILAPTREIAVQIESVLNKIGGSCPGFRAVCVIGGLNVADDRKRLQLAKAIVGTPGRVLHLIQNDVLNTSKVMLLVVDEADKMYTQSFRQDLQRIQKALPAKRQTIACSATFCDDLDKELVKIMRNPLLISTEDRATLLVGIKQFVYELPEEKTSILEMQTKLDALREIFRRIPFKQCLIFAGSQSRADSYCSYLEKDDWPCELISGAQDQKTRLEVFRKFREFKTRIIVATDVMSRGVDSEHVNLVINLELPVDVVTYLHRIGRAGRFGSHGIAISFVATEKDRCTFTRLITQVGCGMNVLKFPQKGEKENERDFWNFSNWEDECKHYGIFGYENLAPLATLDNSALSDSQENKENQICNSDLSNSNSINTKTFCLDSKDSAINMLDLLVDQAEYNAKPIQKLTSDSQQSSSQQLPSSNTIDDASSIAADSLRSSQQDISRYQSVLMQKAAIPTLFEFLVDRNSSGETEAVEKKKKLKIDLFEDYKETVLDNKSLNESAENSVEPSTLQMDACKLANYKALLIDQPTSRAQKIIKHTDVYSDYANFMDNDQNSTSVSEITAAKDESDKATFIVSATTPSKVGDSLEELNYSSLRNDELPNSPSSSRCASSPVRNPVNVSQFPSAAIENEPKPKSDEKQTPENKVVNDVNKNDAIERSDALLHAQQQKEDHDELQEEIGDINDEQAIDHGDHGANDANDIGAEAGALGDGDSSGNDSTDGSHVNSSGFDERTTISESSGIETSKTEGGAELESYETSSTNESLAYDETSNDGDYEETVTEVSHSSNGEYNDADDDSKNDDDDIDSENFCAYISQHQRHAKRLNNSCDDRYRPRLNNNLQWPNTRLFPISQTMWEHQYTEQLACIQNYVMWVSALKEQQPTQPST